jgi:hypothetical protein
MRIRNLKFRTYQQFVSWYSTIVKRFNDIKVVFLKKLRDTLYVSLSY